VVVVVVTMSGITDLPLEALLGGLQNGAAGYVLNAATAHGAAAAVRHLLSACRPLEPPSAAQPPLRPAKGASQQADQGGEAAPRLALTARERDVLRLLAAGKTNREIAGELLLGVGTVKGHVQHLFTKFGVTDRTQAAVRAVELGYLKADS
jgi:DNA-binding NarL/FixJ family response regulator